MPLDQMGRIFKHPSSPHDRGLLYGVTGRRVCTSMRLQRIPTRRAARRSGGGSVSAATRGSGRSASGCAFSRAASAWPRVHAHPASPCSRLAVRCEHPFPAPTASHEQPSPDAATIFRIQDAADGWACGSAGGIVDTYRQSRGYISRGEGCRTRCFRRRGPSPVAGMHPISACQRRPRIEMAEKMCL